MATRTLLVADDSQTVQRIIEMALAGEDVEVVAVADGERAIAHIDERHPDIVLADIGMPGRSGYEIAAYVKQRRDLAHIPVILMAGMFEAADELRARAVGSVEVLVKPLKPQHLAGRIRHWLETAQSSAIDTLDGTFISEAAMHETPAPDSTTEDYFSRLDAAFKSLGRPIGERPAVADSAPDVSAGVAVPTLQELLDKLPEEARSQLSQPSNTASLTPDAVLDAIAERVIARLAEHPDLLDDISKRVARQVMAARDR